MIPLRDNIRTRRPPLVNYLLIAGNIVLFAYELMLGPRLEEFILHESLVPSKFWWGVSHLDPGATLLPLLLSMFLHGGWAHLIGNMLFLHIFGDNVEDRLGHAVYLVFYLFAGTCAALAQLALHAASAVPMVGASGAVAGVMGAYFFLYPGARVLTLVPVIVFIEFIELPAIVFLFLWFAMQFVSGALSITEAAGGAAGGGVAWWAHIGGFLAGLLWAWSIGRRPAPRRYED